MTVSSFTTITLSPVPIISFNVKIPSQTLSAIERSEAFLVHILEASEGGMRLADAFTKGNKNVEGLLGGVSMGVRIKDVEVETRMKTMSLPMLKAKGVMRVLRCSILADKMVEVGDHMIVIARIEEILDSDEEGELEGKIGLCYVDGRYRRVGDVIEETVNEKMDGER
jgi:flavin reductase (DIM6/NTAB) family NADH-FMN oxidoreductase RutF